MEIGPQTGASLQRTPTAQNPFKALLSPGGDSLTTPPCKGALVPILLPVGGAVRVGPGRLRASLIPIRQHFLLMGTPDLVRVACLL